MVTAVVVDDLWHLFRDRGMIEIIGHPLLAIDYLGNSWRISHIFLLRTLMILIVDLCPLVVED